MIVGWQEVKTVGEEPMESPTDPSLADQFAAALDWWREVGVDHDYTDDPQKLLQDEVAEEPARSRKPAAQQEASAEAPKPEMGGDRANWPQSLEGFAPWWMSEPTLDETRRDGRVPPRGVHGADLMVVIPMPEADDSETLLSGAQGKLVANMLRAMEIGPDAAYIASALPRHIPLADWDGLRTSGLGNVLLHHISLAAPKRLLVLGGDVLPLLGHEKRRGVLDLAMNDATIQLLASFAPENLIENAKLRADLWRRWLDWTGKA